MTSTTRERPRGGPTDRPRDRPRGAPGTAVREVRAAVRVRDLAELMDRRPELAGVYRPADLAVEAIRWSA